MKLIYIQKGCIISYCTYMSRMHCFKMFNIEPGYIANAMTQSERLDYKISSLKFN